MIWVGKLKVFPGDLWQTPIGRVVVRGFRRGRVVLREQGVLRLSSPQDAIFLLRQGRRLERGPTLACICQECGVEYARKACRADLDGMVSNGFCAPCFGVFEKELDEEEAQDAFDAQLDFTKLPQRP